MGLLTELFLSRIRLPRDIHRHAFRRYAGRTALRFEDGSSMRYGELRDRSYSLAEAWRAMGLGAGDNVFAQIATEREFFEIRTAALEAGIVLTIFHAGHGPDFIALAARAADPKLFIADPGLAPGCAEAFRAARPGAPVWQIGAGGDYEAAIAGHAPRPSRARIDPADPMVLGFTSGTTGPPKGLLSSHGAAVASLKLVIRNLRIRPDRRAASISLTPIPLVGAGSGLIFPSMLSGGTLVVMNEYTPARLCAMVREHGVTRLFLTPSHLIDLLDEGAAAAEALATLTHIIYGTSPMPAAKLEEALTRFGAAFQQGYGQAEILPPVSLLTPEDHRRGAKPAPRAVLASSGRVVKGVRVRISDARGRALPAGEIGEIHVDTPTRMAGYLDPRQNRGVILDDGYFRTGDLGFLDAAGYLHVLDREADLIRRAGGVIFPRLVEEEAHDHPAVKECCLVEAGGRVVLFVSLRRKYRDGDASAIAGEVAALLARRLAPEQRPDEIRMLPEIPRSFLGKILRRAARERIPDARQ